MQDIVDRFWAKTVSRSTGCMEWNAAISKQGYGQFKYRGQMRLAHRVCYELTKKEEVPTGYYIFQTCSNRLCVNPEHLTLKPLSKRRVQEPFEVQVSSFWEKVDKTIDCWNWTGAKDTKGYGTVRFSGKTRKCHKLSWEMANGFVKNGLFVLHKCDNPACVNPDHLYLGTHQDNMNDKVARGRQAKGQEHGKKVAQSMPVKISDQDVRLLRELASQGSDYRDLAPLFNISPGHAQDIIQGVKRKHVS